jgi:hypothetical protein
VRALLLAVACFFATGLGVVLAFVPVAGAVFAFGAPVLALLGVILGGLDLSRARREGKPRDTVVLGTVLSALGFFPALLTALTCGVCNALVTSGPIEVRRGMHFRVGQGAIVDGGVAPGWPLPPPPSAPDPDHAAPAPAPSGPDRPAPSNGLPPPPLPAGPGALP